MDKNLCEECKNLPEGEVVKGHDHRGCTPNCIYQENKCDVCTEVTPQKENNWNEPLIDRFNLAGKITVEHAKYIEFILEKIVTQAISEDREKMRLICRKIYVDGANWAEWGMSDDDAGKEFDEELESVLSINKSK